MKRAIQFGFIDHVLMIILLTVCAAATVSAQTADPRKTSTSSVEAEVEKAIREYHDAFSRFDIGTVLSYTADDGFFYDATGGYSTGTQQKADLKNNLQLIKPGAKDSVELTDLKITVIGPDTADTKTSVTNMLSPEELAQDNERVAKRKPATITKPVNLGFEDGTIH